MMLTVSQLSVKEKTGRLLLNEVSIKIMPGQVVGLTGHSGSGKTTLLRSVFGMLHRDCQISSGEILLNDKEISRLSQKEHRELCGKTISHIPQAPMTAFDSRLKIGCQIQETFRKRLKLDKTAASQLAKDMLSLVNLKDTHRILNAYPAELSGGMLQRVAAAILLGMSPDYILADEPTAALDEENRNLLLEVMRTQMRDKGILLVSHDVEALRGLCDTVYVLGAGTIIEQGSMEQLLSAPKTEWMKHFSGLNKKESRGEWKWEKL
ncbi:MAG: ATP-binding cassette domain-containing protein [Lacrimispora sphenoides]